MVQKMKLEPIMLSHKGKGKIDGNHPINLSDYLIQPSDISKAEPLCFIPKKLHISEEINGTIYDVTGSFSGEIEKSLFHQLKDLILSENLLDTPQN